MSDKLNVGRIVTDELGKLYKLEKIDIGSDAVLKKNMMTFTTEVLKAQDFGHICILKMNGMFGLMKMETVVISPLERDVPLVNFDWISVAGKQTFIAEFYDCMLEPYPDEYVRELYDNSMIYPELAEYDGGKHWYDEVKMYCSCGKTSRKPQDKFIIMTKAYMKDFAEQLQHFGQCDSKAKKKKIRWFAETLIEKGGPAVNSVTKLFGAEVARRLILKHMYGVE